MSAMPQRIGQAPWTWRRITHRLLAFSNRAMRLNESIARLLLSNWPLFCQHPPVAQSF